MLVVGGGFFVIFQTLVLINSYEHLEIWKKVFSEGFNPLLTPIRIQKYPVMLRSWLCCSLARALGCLQSGLWSQGLGCFRRLGWAAPSSGERRAARWVPQAPGPLWLLAAPPGMAGGTAAKFALSFLFALQLCGAGHRLWERGGID